MCQCLSIATGFHARVCLCVCVCLCQVLFHIFCCSSFCHAWSPTIGRLAFKLILKRSQHSFIHFYYKCYQIYIYSKREFLIATRRTFIYDRFLRSGWYGDGLHVFWNFMKICQRFIFLLLFFRIFFNCKFNCKSIWYWFPFDQSHPSILINRNDL